VRAAAAIALACVALTACGGDDGNGEAAPPSGPRPSGPGANGPPPAWLETEGGSFWLGYSTFCWGGTCADYVAPSCDSEHVPKIAVRRGERVTAHLGFEPREVSLTFFPGGESGGQPSGGRNPSWRVERAGAFALFAAPKEGGDASYVACLELD
jgi:hypothetical protein